MSPPTDAADSPTPGTPAEALVTTLHPRLPVIDLAAFMPAGLDDADDDPSEIGAFVRRVDDAADAAARAWPDLKPPPQRPDDSRGALIDPWRTLAARRTEIVNLQKVRQQQHAALERARDEIVSLDDGAKLLRARLTQQEKETAAARQAQQRAEADLAAQRGELEQANTNFVELLRQAAELRASFEQREREMSALKARVEGLQLELSAKAAGSADLGAAIAEAKARYYKDFDKRTAQFEAETEKLARLIGAREERIRTLEDENAQLDARCDALARNAVELDIGKRDAEEKLEAQTAMVGFLDATLQTEREATGAKIATLTADLHRERLARAADAHEAAAVCQGIMRLLPRLAREPGLASEAMARMAERDVSSEPEQKTASA